MQILLIEDETYAAKRLQTLLAECLPEGNILAVCDSIAGSVAYLDAHPQPDLIFMDIQLADGISFDIFAQTEVTAPVIFSTAFDEYTLKAFKVNSIDYLLKPVDKNELAAAIDKFKRLHQSQTAAPDWQQLLQAVRAPQPDYKTRFLVKSGQEYVRIDTANAAYFYSEDGLTFLMQKSGKRFLLEQSLDRLAQQLDPADFFRINRKQIIGIDGIEKIHAYFNHRLKLDLKPAFTEAVIVSRTRVKAFKKWAGAD